MQPSDQERAFAAYLQRLAKDHKQQALATLRRVLGNPVENGPRAFQWLGPWVGRLEAADLQRYLLVAGLFALCPAPCPSVSQCGNIGTVFARLREVVSSVDSLEQRFVRLLAAHQDDLPGHLRRTLALACEAQIDVNWAQLLADLRGWEHPRRPVQLAWAREFWDGAEQSASVSEEDSQES